MSTRLSLAGVPGPLQPVFVEAQGLSESLVDIAGIGDYASAQAPSGGFTYFEGQYDRERARRRRERAELLELEKEARAIPEVIDREIAVLLREQDARELKRQELERLRKLADSLRAEEARVAYGERVAKALDRAIEKGSFSALEALDREIQRAQEEEDSMLLSITMMIDDNG